MNNTTVPVDQNYDRKPVGTITLVDQAILTPDTILVPDVLFTKEGPVIIGFSIVDRDRLINKEKRAEVYGDIDWKQPAKLKGVEK